MNFSFSSLASFFTGHFRFVIFWLWSILMTSQFSIESLIKVLIVAWILYIGDSTGI